MAEAATPPSNIVQSPMRRVPKPVVSKEDDLHEMEGSHEVDGKGCEESSISKSADDNLKAGEVRTGESKVNSDNSRNHEEEIRKSPTQVDKKGRSDEFEGKEGGNHDETLPESEAVPRADSKPFDITSKDEDEDDPFAGLEDLSSMDIYDLANYTFGKKDVESKARVVQQVSVSEMAQALEKNFKERGMRRSVGAVILVHNHNFPHVLLLQRSDGRGEFTLPGGRLRPGESDEEGLQRKLGSKLKPMNEGGEEEQELEIGEKRTRFTCISSSLKPFLLSPCIMVTHVSLNPVSLTTDRFLIPCFVFHFFQAVCNWYAIDFNRRYYPYVPAHVTKPKEELHVYIVTLPSKFTFSVPKNLQLVAVPLFELFKNSNTYGDVISAVPALLSRWHINFC